MKTITIGSATHTGLEKNENQDFYAYPSPGDSKTNKKGVLLALADGMGGHKGGSIASKLAIETLMDEYYRNNSGDVSVALEKSFIKANEAVNRRAGEDIKLANMGTTLTAVVLKKGMMYHANVGDSRSYIIDRNSIVQLTKDHSYVANLVKAGAITEEEALNHPEANVLTQAIGLKPKLTPDVPRDPVRLIKDQYILMCCDGLYRMVSDDEIVAGINEYREPEIICEKMVEMSNDRGGPDNITVLIVRIDKTGLISELLSKYIPNKR